ncbi:MAG: DNA polymerase III subunit delta, partial [Clostridia bacterium]|nr:DNA polymerase III subunit delta [Clostridia bacterium]
MAKAERFGVGVDELKSRLRLDPAGAYLFFGEEEYLKKYYLQKFVSLVEEGGFGDLNVSTYDYALKGMDQLRGEFDTVPMLGDRRLVIVRSLQPLKLSERDGERLLDLLDSVPKHLIAIIFCLSEEFVADKAALKKKFPHRLAEKLTAVDFSHLSENALVSWIGKGLGSAGLRVTDEAARLLVRICASDMMKMRSELDKLENYLKASGRDIVTADDVRLLVTGDPQAQVYELTDAVLARNAELAL